MSEAYLIAFSQGRISPLSGVSHVEQVRPIVQSLISQSGVPARRVQEIHWHGGDKEFWFNSLRPAVGFAPKWRVSIGLLLPCWPMHRCRIQPGY